MEAARGGRACRSLAASVVVLLSTLGSIVSLSATERIPPIEIPLDEIRSAITNTRYMTLQTNATVLLEETRAKVHRSEHISVHHQPAEPTSIPLMNLMDTVFSGIVSIGNPPQSFRVIFDTGSTVTWVYGAQNLARTGFLEFIEPSRDGFIASHSKTFVSTGHRLQLAYGSGGVLASEGVDTLRLGDLAVHNMAIAIAETSAGKITGNANGIVGLGMRGLFRDASARGEHAYLDALGDQDVIKPVRVGFQLSPNPNQPGSRLALGAFDVLKYAKHPLSWAPVHGHDYWTVQLDSLKIAGIEACPRGKSCAGIVDTGTSFLLGPRYLRERPGAIPEALRSTSCKSVAPLPRIEIRIAGKLYVLEGEDYKLEERGDCVLAISWHGLNVQDFDDTWILGDTLYVGNPPLAVPLSGTIYSGMASHTNVRFPLCTESLRYSKSTASVPH